MDKIFDLYIDESGNFSENELTKGNQNFANQLVGILVPSNRLTEENAEQILKACYRAANFYSFPTIAVHGSTINSGSGYDHLISSLVAQIQQNNWQPVRLSNRERVNYGDPASNYVNMLSELALRIYQQESNKGADRITLNFYCAFVSIGGNYTIPKREYRRSLKNYLAFAAVRLGLAEESSHWRIGRFELLSANENRRLQICDLLSNASHGQYTKCNEQTASKLKTAFGIYDQTLIRHPLCEKLDLFIEEGSFGLAIRNIAEQAVKIQNNDNTQPDMMQRLDSLIDTLANLTATKRDLHLNILTTWLEQIINQQRSLDLGYEVILWLRERLVCPLTNRLNEKTSLSWFTYALHCWTLTIFNHQGKLEQARKEADAMKEVIPNLAEHWELIPLLMRGLVVEAVHYIDCWEYYKAAKSMLLIFKYYYDISSLFIDALPEIFPQRIRSQLEAKALGTWLQCEIHALAFLPHRVSLARNISDVCICKFSNLGDKQRQYQYRTQLETIAKNFDLAKKYLAKSLDLSDSSHQAIAQKIITLTKMSQGFALLHWLRLGTTAFLANDSSEWSEFSNALQKSKLLNTDWCHGNQSVEYPTYGILRRVALINLIWYRPNTALGRLRNLDPVSNKNIVFGAIQIATYAEIAALQWENHSTKAKLLLNCPEQKSLGMIQLINILSTKTNKTFPRFWQLTQLWSESIYSILNDTIVSDIEVKRKLLAIGTTVNY